MRSSRTSSTWKARSGKTRQPRTFLRIEELETRTVPSTALVNPPLAHTNLFIIPNSLTAPFTPLEISASYGYNKIKLTDSGGHKHNGDGTGQTIAVVDAFNQPNIVSDVAAFDTQFGLPTLNLTQVDELGNPITGQVANNQGWGLETSLDLEWVHSMAPQAHILLVEASSNSYADLLAANKEAVKLGAGVVSNSWGSSEFSGESSYDSTFTSTGNTATFVFSTGDSGAPGEYPAYSPNVLAVGGTNLTINGTTSLPKYGHENAWSSGGGGKSSFEPKPAYQNGVNHTSKREIPDISADADPNSGVYVYDSYYPGGPWFQVGGTSLSAPLWSGLLGIANQGRALIGNGTLGDAQNAMYGLPTTDFHDVIHGSNGNPAGTGYDLATGIGTPKANLIAPALQSVASSPPPGFIVQGGGHGAGGTASPLMTGAPSSAVVLYAAAPASGTAATLSQTPAVTNAPQAVAPATQTSSVPSAVMLSGGSHQEASRPDAVADPAAPVPVTPDLQAVPVSTGSVSHGKPAAVSAITARDAVFQDEAWEASFTDQADEVPPMVGDPVHVTDATLAAGMVALTAVFWQGRLVETEKRRWRGVAF